MQPIKPVSQANVEYVRSHSAASRAESRIELQTKIVNKAVEKGKMTAEEGAAVLSKLSEQSAAVADASRKGPAEHMSKAERQATRQALRETRREILSDLRPAADPSDLPAHPLGEGSVDIQA